MHLPFLVPVLLRLLANNVHNLSYLWVKILRLLANTTFYEVFPLCYKVHIPS